MHRDLMVLPDFNGNRSPLAEPRARGVIHGLGLDHSFDSLARLYYATAIGIALGTRHIVDALNRHAYRIDTLHLTGGHAGSPLLVRLYADVTDCRVLLPEEQCAARHCDRRLPRRRTAWLDVGCGAGDATELRHN